MSSVMKAEKNKSTTTNREYSREEKNKIVEKLITARVGLLLRHPFFGNLATRLKLVDASDWCQTMATDGRNFYYNNDFVNKLKPKEAEFGFAHEVLHNVFDHCGRRNDRDPLLSNIAADYAANQILVDEKIGQVPSWIKIYQDNKYRSVSYEEIYEDLFKNVKKINLDELGELLDEHLDGEGNGDKDSEGEGGKSSKGAPKLTAEERKQIRDEIKEAILAAAQSAAGKVPAGIARMISDLIEPKMDWRQLLRMNIQSVLKNNFSFSRPNRKSQHSGAILPGIMNEETIDICVGFDMSGSITNQMAKEMISEVKNIMDEYVDFKIQLWCFDTEIYNYETFTGDTADMLLEYEVKGGGGTEFMANWDFMKERGIEPKRFIMFTDGYPCGSWGDEHYCETIFIIHGNETIVPPFGQFAYYN